MSPTILTALLAAVLGADGPPPGDVKTLIDTIEALQEPVEDFRCEFEGSLRFAGKVLEQERAKGTVREDGLHETFSGLFIWKRGGDAHCDSLIRTEIDASLRRQTLVVRMGEQRAEMHQRYNDGGIGNADIDTPSRINSSRSDCLGSIFLIDTIKRFAFDDVNYMPSVTDGEIDGRPMKVLSIALKGVPDDPDFLLGRYWIDLRRNGHVVRTEGYQSGSEMVGRLDIELAPFQVGDVKVWMPVSGKGVGYAALDEDRKPIVVKGPTSFTTIKVLDGTMEFNKHPGPGVFTIQYKPGTPISDHLRKMRTEFGQAKIGPKPTKADMERMLNEQVAGAEQQESELVAVPVSEGFAWSSWLAWGFGAIVVISLVALWVQRQRH
jgi:hypothetical protein